MSISNGNVVSITSTPGHALKYITVTVTVEVEVLKSSYGDMMSKNTNVLGLTLGPCTITQKKEGV